MSIAIAPSTIFSVPNAANQESLMTKAKTSQNTTFAAKFVFVAQLLPLDIFRTPLRIARALTRMDGTKQAILATVQKNRECGTLSTGKKS